MRTSKNIFDSEAVELNNGMLEETGMTSILSDLESREYFYEFTLYDRNSIKAAIFNKTITIINKPTEELQIEEVEFGVDILDQCVELENNTYSNKVNLCLYPTRVTGFKQISGMSLFDFDMIVYDYSGDIVYEYYNIYQEAGYKELTKNALNYDDIDGFVLLPLNELSLGEYSLNVTLKDRFGKKETTIMRNFTVYKPQNELEVTDYFKGFYYGDDCSEFFADDVYYYTEDSICLQPTVEGFKETPEGKIWFAMDSSIKTSNNELVKENKNRYPVQETPPLSTWFNRWSLSDFEEGAYIYEVTITDILTGHEVSVSVNFKIVEELGR